LHGMPSTLILNYMKKLEMKSDLKNLIAVLVVIGLIFALGYYGEQPDMAEEIEVVEPLVIEITAQVEVLEEPEIAEPKYEINITDKGVKYIVYPGILSWPGPPKGGIPSIDNPRYETLEEADQWIGDDELVLAIIYKDVKRAYPFRILVWHEVVNDVIAGDPILITYCPLCGAGLAFERTIDGRIFQFEASSQLYNSNLVLYDKQTDTLWTQIGGLAIIGELTGTELKPVSIDTVVWGDWKAEHPDTEVLSKRTGYKNKPYGREDIYRSYYEDSYVLYRVENEDNRIFPKTVVFGIEINGVYKAYQEDDLIKLETIEDRVAGIDVIIERDAAGIVKVTNLENGEEIIKERNFWFAWYAFHPDTELYER